MYITVRQLTVMIILIWKYYSPTNTSSVHLSELSSTFLNFPCQKLSNLVWKVKKEVKSLIIVYFCLLFTHFSQFVTRKKSRGLSDLLLYEKKISLDSEKLTYLKNKLNHFLMFKYFQKDYSSSVMNITWYALCNKQQWLY